ncbi:conserved exported hypothetical protein [Luteimonas sp. 9C]|nr:conserved exported hypothetical protein [Luteimonas sp. 9C]
MGRYHLILLSIAFACTSCALHPKVDASQCEARGGTVQGVGMFATSACVIPYADGGRECKDGAECQGMCRAAPDATIGSNASGTCQINTHDIYGCYDEVRAGVVVAGMCFD